MIVFRQKLTTFLLIVITILILINFNFKIKEHEVISQIHHRRLGSDEEFGLTKSRGKLKPKRRFKRKSMQDGSERLHMNYLNASDLLAKIFHPRISPRPGTDIAIEKHFSLLSCQPQANCVIPELQLQPKLKIYLCERKWSIGVRFHYIIHEGLVLHPNVELLTTAQIHLADYIIYLPGSTPWSETECNQTYYAKKLIVLDEFDSSYLFLPAKTKEQYQEMYGSLHIPWYNLYFKRSYVNRTDGIFQGFTHLHQHDVFPITYALSEGFIPSNYRHTRPTEILCTLRGSKTMVTRLRVQEWVLEYAIMRGVPNVVTKAVDSGNRTSLSLKYVRQMASSEIIVTVNPSEWEGDYRLWEAMGSGALIFVDPLFVPHPFPLIDKEHVIYFNNHNRSELFEKLDYYRSHPDEARRIALNGYFHAMKYHRTVNLIDYVLRTAHVKERLVMKKKEESVSIPEYNYSGQYLNYMARLQEKMILKCDRPGVYDPFYLHRNNLVLYYSDCPDLHHQHLSHHIS